MTVLLTGLLTCLALIIAIGPQSVWLLRQGLSRDRVLLAIACCLVGDLLLIGLGVAGVGVVLEHAPWLLEVIRWLGVAYLLWFALGAFGRVWAASRRTATSETSETSARTVHVEMSSEDSGDTGGGAASDSSEGPRTGTLPSVRVTKVSSVSAVAATGMTVSVLNPHAWVDTMVVLGTMANTFGDERWLFGAGAMLASALWFAVLGLGAASLSRFLNSPTAWKIIDLSVGVTMVVVAGILAVGGF